MANPPNLDRGHPRLSLYLAPQAAALNGRLPAASLEKAFCRRFVAPLRHQELKKACK
jgi:hypothetical protein